MAKQRTRIELSRDGSHTVYSETAGSYFHNPNGAVEESLYVYFESSGISRALQRDEDVSVMEIGFGTGLNLLLLADLVARYRPDAQVKFTSVEAYPLMPDQVQQLNFAAFIKHKALFEALPAVFGKLQDAHQSGEPVSGKLGEVHYEIHPCLFSKLKLRPKRPFTHILHDPFDPVVSPELWKPGVFKWLRERSAEDAVLTTFGASTAARASMAVGGWLVARAPGALGKREMTVASLSEEKLRDFKRLNEARLKQRWEAGELSI
ncbi:tRNA U34 5-methylaminomethyl-2-thiouridine-forming methyltransferase MnmC [Cyclonatronum proteinivorum]|uniref:tRNA U34 5-methylaminomethyl-2-thiouridine-forming methyltransferase MnmC n=1 Tax=Cyclonatronum proteinivorum TaxID=1457365 RepID=A0A345UGX5_9BACT|nr:MnmC family methyltransferase [Cyclonatronum proteinivorum]AXI99726.1 tRNA U34 5-methylaminomethyl-2-thiouridine-forming methyltransferase MnmC [Cyclonatronum proteinivorum]